MSNIKTYALLWSKKSNGLHVEPLEATIAAGLNAMVQNRTTDYVLLAVGEKEDIHAKADAIRPELLNRSKAI